MKSKLALKLFLSYLVVLGIAGVMLMLTMQAVLPRAFERHMGAMMGSGDMAGMMWGMGNGARVGANANTTLFEQFRGGVNEALWWAGALAVLAAVLSSWAFSRRIVRPIRQMQQASQRIAEGRFSERVPVSGDDEIADLAQSFNRMAEELAQVEERRRRLIGDVAHELRTPLTAIKGYMEGLMDGVLPAEAETFALVHEEAGRLNRLVDDLQELSRIEAGAIALQPAPTSVQDTLSTIEKRLGPQFTAKSLQLEVAAVPSGLKVWADPDRFTQILTNLLGNALRYTPSGGQVKVTAEKKGEMVEICITDTGIGISPEALPHIFERFYRADPARSRQNGEGSGIGLTVVRHLVEAHNGQVWAESEGEGKGSRFCVRLPAA